MNFTAKILAIGLSVTTAYGMERDDVSPSTFSPISTLTEIPVPAEIPSLDIEKFQNTRGGTIEDYVKTIHPLACSIVEETSGILKKMSTLADRAQQF